MPLITHLVDLGAVGDTVLVPNGNVLTGATVHRPVGATPFGEAFVASLVLGNKQAIGPISDRGRLRIGCDVPDEDVSEGLVLRNGTVQAGLVLPVTVSYARGGPSAARDEDRASRRQGRGEDGAIAYVYG